MFKIKKNGIVYVFGRVASLLASAIGFTPPTGMSATNVQDAIDEIGGKTYSVISDGTKTRKQMLDSLFTLMNADGKSFTPDAYLMLGYLVARCVNTSIGTFNSFTSTTAIASYVAQITVANGTSSWSSVTIGSTYSVSDASSSIVESGTVYSLHI